MYVPLLKNQITFFFPSNYEINLFQVHKILHFEKYVLKNGVPGTWSLIGVVSFKYTQV